MFPQSPSLTQTFRRHTGRTRLPVSFPHHTPFYAKLPDLRALKGKHVLVSGKFEAYQGRPEIILTDASQIKVLP